MWVKLSLRTIINLGLYETLVDELRFEDESKYKKLLRMIHQDFDEILGLFQDDLFKQKQLTFIHVLAHAVE